MQVTAIVAFGRLWVSLFLSMLVFHVEASGLAPHNRDSPPSYEEATSISYYDLPPSYEEATSTSYYDPPPSYEEATSTSYYDPPPSYEKPSIPSYYDFNPSYDYEESTFPSYYTYQYSYEEPTIPTYYESKPSYAQKPYSYYQFPPSALGFRKASCGRADDWLSHHLCCSEPGVPLVSVWAAAPGRDWQCIDYPRYNCQVETLIWDNAKKYLTHDTMLSYCKARGKGAALFDGRHPPRH